MVKSLPKKPSLEHLKHEARAILKSHSRGEATACETLRLLPRLSGKADEEILASEISLTEVQHALVLEYGFKNWKELRTHIIQKGMVMITQNDTKQTPNGLNSFQTELLLSTCPIGGKIAEVTPLHPEDKYPLLVRIESPDGGQKEVELYVYNNEVDSAEREAELLPVLGDLGLPVPQVLAGPATDPENPDAGQMIVENHLPGQFLPVGRVAAKEMDLTCRLIVEGVERLRRLTEPL